MFNIFVWFLQMLGYDPLNELKSVLKVVVPDETNGSLLTKTLPVRPHMTTRDVCKIIAHKLRITNPQDYSLFKLIDGQGNNNVIIINFIVITINKLYFIIEFINIFELIQFFLLDYSL